MLHRLITIGNATSQFINAVVLFGDEDESISGRSYRRACEGSRRWKAVMWFIDGLFSPVQQAHCRKAYDNDVAICMKRVEEHQRLFGS
jgi:hypothetical protein